jgi:hypothetical protein
MGIGLVLLPDKVMDHMDSFAKTVELLFLWSHIAFAGKGLSFSAANWFFHFPNKLGLISRLRATSEILDPSSIGHQFHGINFKLS